MIYCRVSIEHTTRGCVFKKDFDAQHVFGPLIRAFASEFVRQGAIQEGEHYNSFITPRYDGSPMANARVEVDKAKAQEPRPAWLNIEAPNGALRPDQHLAFFTLELRFHESGIIYHQDVQIVTLDYFWQNIQTALVQMRVLKNGDLYIPRIAIRDDDQANFDREEVRLFALEDETPLIELVEVESSAPDFPHKSIGAFAPVEARDVGLVSPVELTQLDEARQNQVQIFIAQETFEALQAIARLDVQVEQGGALVGQVYRDGESFLVEITGHIVAEGASANLAELHYNFDSWLRQSEVLKARFPGQQIVGWYHTHLVQISVQPDDPAQELQTTELFFSDHDRFMHRQFFSDPWYVAMVLGPQGNAAFFRWFGDKISANRRFYVLKPGEGV
jgi:hypothetical protein